MNLVPAALWSPAAGQDDTRVLCRLCAHACAIAPGQSGVCRVRRNVDGKLYSLASAAVMAANLDPIEKKPLFHVLPGSASFSIGTPGCNMSCAFCQNHTLSQGRLSLSGQILPAMPPALPGQIVNAAIDKGAASISYTYSEPTIFFELVEACARLANSQGLVNILVSNAFQSETCLETLQPLVQAANFDLKSFSDAFYRRYCGARLAPALDTLRRAVGFGWWVEVTTLLIPGLNDSPEELRDMAGFIKKELGTQVPWHISRFRPCHRMTDLPPTPLASVERALAIGKEEGLLFVYAGNVQGHDSENTFCPVCGKTVVRRAGYRVAHAFDGSCPFCGTSIAGLWRI